MSIKRPRPCQNDIDDDLATPNFVFNGNDIFLRFLVIQSLDGSNPVTSLSPFVIEKQIESLIGTPKSVTDLEAKSALSLSITNLKIPHSDFKSNIHQYVLNKCQSVWEEQTGNKLHELKPDFNSKCSFLGYSRQIQTKITRCRIGHTRLTHSYLLTNEQPPFCISCNEPFTVKHFLITCTEFNYIRNRYFTAKTVKELFSDTSSDIIINFLKETNLFNKL